jgi:ABC-type lipoprotein release transport system permease subunit
MIRSSDSRDAIVGARLLDELQIRIGQKFVVTAQHQDGTLQSELLRVRGVINSGMKDIDSSLIMIGRERAGLLTGNPGRVHELAIILTDPDLEGQVHKQVAEMIGKNRIIAEDPEIEAVSWERAMPNLANAIKLDYASQKFIFLIILMIVTIGVILALGSKPMTLRGMIMLEALALGLIAAVCGSLLGSLVTWYLVSVGIDLAAFVPETLEFGGVVFDPVLRAKWHPEWMIRIAGYVVGLVLLAALYPAIKAGRITPVEGMRHH